MDEYTLIALTSILFLGIGCQWLAWRFKLPAIMFLLSCGVIIGPVFNLIEPDLLFGDLLYPFISLSVAVILFEGSITLKIQQIKGLERIIRRMITYGVIITLGITGFATHFFLDFSWEVSMLFGAIMVVTGPTVIVPMLRTVRPKENIAHILRWEGILIDPIGATLAVLVFQFIVSGNMGDGFASGALIFGKTLGIGFVLGIAGGSVFGTLLRLDWIPRYLHNFSALALVCMVFTLSNMLEAESGLLSVTVMGIWLANMKNVDLEDILDFKESLSVLLISVLFIVLAARLDLKTMFALGWIAFAVLGVIQFVARPLNIHFSAFGSKLSMKERHLLSWIAPRGIVAAAISALFAIRLKMLGFEQADQMVALVFMVIIGTVLLQSLTAGLFAKYLGVSEPEPKGFLIIGADLVARTFAQELQKNGFRVLLTDQNWDNIKTAKMEHLPAYWGNPVSEHAERHLNLIGIGRLLALSPNTELNALSAKHYRLEFGCSNMFRIRTTQANNQVSKDKSMVKHGGKPLFSENITYDYILDLITKGAEIKTTALTEKFTFEDYLQQKDEQRIPLFAIDPKEIIRPMTQEIAYTPKANWKIIALTIERT